MTSVVSGSIQLSGATRSMPVTDHSVRSLLAPDRRPIKNNGTISASQTFDHDVLGKRSATECRQTRDDCVNGSDDDLMTSPPCKRLCSGYTGDVSDKSISSPGSTCRPPFVGVPPFHASYWSPRHLEDAAPFIDGDSMTTAARSTECQKQMTSPSASASGMRSATAESATVHSVQQPRPTSSPSSRHHREQPISDADDKSDRYEPVIELESDDLWQRFYSLCTEMVITKSGRSN